MCLPLLLLNHLINLEAKGKENKIVTLFDFHTYNVYFCKLNLTNDYEKYYWQ